MREDSLQSRREGPLRAMAAIGLSVGLGALLSPKRLMRLFGVPASEITGAGALGWRLFAIRTLYLSGRAFEGDEAAREAFLPVQLLDQAVFLHAYRTRQPSRYAAVLAMATSAAIIALDAASRR